MGSSFERCEGEEACSSFGCATRAWSYDMYVENRLGRGQSNQRLGTTPTVAIDWTGISRFLQIFFFWFSHCGRLSPAGGLLATGNGGYSAKICMWLLFFAYCRFANDLNDMKTGCIYKELQFYLFETDIYQWLFYAHLVDNIEERKIVMQITHGSGQRQCFPVRI